MKRASSEKRNNASRKRAKREAVDPIVSIVDAWNTHRLQTWETFVHDRLVKEDGCWLAPELRQQASIVRWITHRCTSLLEQFFQTAQPFEWFHHSNEDASGSNSGSESDPDSPSDDPSTNVFVMIGGSEWRFELRAHPWALKIAFFSHLVWQIRGVLRGVDEARLPPRSVCYREHINDDSDQNSDYGESSDSDENADDEQPNRADKVKIPSWKRKQQVAFSTQLHSVYDVLRAHYELEVYRPCAGIYVAQHLPVNDVTRVVESYVMDFQFNADRRCRANRWLIKRCQFNDSIWQRAIAVHQWLEVHATAMRISSDPWIQARSQDPLSVIEAAERYVAFVERKLEPLFKMLDADPIAKNPPDPRSVVRDWDTSDEYYARIKAVRRVVQEEWANEIQLTVPTAVKYLNQNHPMLLLLEFCYPNWWPFLDDVDSRYWREWYTLHSIEQFHSRSNL